jgi:uncharacterized protein DUF4190
MSSKESAVKEKAEIKSASAKNQAILAFVLSLLAVTIFGAITGIPAAILSGFARKKMNETKNFEGKDLATAALVIGVIGSIAGSVVGWIVLLSDY